MRFYTCTTIFILLMGCNSIEKEQTPLPETIPEPDFVLTADQTHNKFSSAIPPAIRVPDGSVIEAFTHEATGGQFNLESTEEEMHNINMDKVHTITGPVYVEGAEPGDVLAVELLELEPGEWGWTALSPGFGFLPNEEEISLFKTYKLNKEDQSVDFADGIRIPLKPFAGVMGVAPPTEEMLNTIPPRANGGNMDDPHLVKGVTVYFPVFVKGALFSIGDTHAVQGLGEVCGTAIECPMRIRYRLSIRKNFTISEPQYETDTYYATTGYGTSLDEAAQKATEYMVEHLVSTRNMSWEEAYMLCSLVADLKIAEVVDLPHLLVTMHLPKSIFLKNQK
ncbi:MAG: acetamidase/formamidase family protein [Flavobacteriaceae bacterium]